MILQFMLTVSVSLYYLNKILLFLKLCKYVYTMLHAILQTFKAQNVKISIHTVTHVSKNEDVGRTKWNN